MRLPKEDKAGLYITVIFHLVVIIALLASQIGTALKKENSFVLDFSKQEQVEKLRKEASLKEEISRKLDDLIASRTGEPIRNIAVDRGSILKDDRNTDADQLYKDAERLARELKSGITPEEPDDYVAQPAFENFWESVVHALGYLSVLSCTQRSQVAVAPAGIFAQVA